MRHPRRRNIIRGCCGAAILVLSIVFVSNAYAQWPTGVVVEETYHNLTIPATSPEEDMQGLIRNYGQVCVYCHGPHNVRTDRRLWNRPIPSGGYRMWDQDDFDMSFDPQPSGNSLSCLSCHDGTIGLDDILQLPVTYTGPGPARTTMDECDGCHSGKTPDFEGVWIDTDLRKQHPFSMFYDPTLNNNFRTVAEVEAAGLVLYDGKIQCMTCHEPHSQQFQPFLRITRSGRTICFACHKNNIGGENTAHHW